MNKFARCTLTLLKPMSILNYYVFNFLTQCLCTYDNLYGNFSPTKYIKIICIRQLLCNWFIELSYHVSWIANVIPNKTNAKANVKSVYLVSYVTNRNRIGWKMIFLWLSKARSLSLLEISAFVRQSSWHSKSKFLVQRRNKVYIKFFFTSIPFQNESSFVGVFVVTGSTTL